MPNVRVPTIVLTLLLVLPGAEAVAEPDGADALPAVIEAVKAEIAQAQEESGDQGLLLRIERAVVSLRIERSHRAGAEGGPSFTVLGFEAGATAGTSTTRRKSELLRLELRPDEDVLVGARAELGLAAAIRQLKAAVRTAMDTRPYMELERATVELDFGLERAADGEIRFVIGSAAAGAESAIVHRVELSLVPGDF